LAKAGRGRKGLGRERWTTQIGPKPSFTLASAQFRNGAEVGLDLLAEGASAEVAFAGVRRHPNFINIQRY
jgi:hypothetical protein